MSHARFCTIERISWTLATGTTIPKQTLIHTMCPEAFPNTSMAPRISSILQHTLPLPALSLHPSPHPTMTEHKPWTFSLVSMRMATAGLALGTESQKSWVNKLHYPQLITEVSFSGQQNATPSPVSPALASPSNSTANLSNGTDRTATRITRSKSTSWYGAASEEARPNESPNRDVLRNKHQPWFGLQNSKLVSCKGC